MAASSARMGCQSAVQQLVQLPAQQLRPLGDHVPGAACGEFLVLEFLLQGLELHVGHAFGGAHQGGRPDQPG